MAKLILTLEGSVIREIPIDKERIMIGRKPQNDIQIENLAVSGEHACIVTILADSFLEDLGSTNGTLVNGNQVKKHILQNNDVIEIGKYKMKYAWLMEREHVNVPSEIFEVLDEHFTVEHRSYYPLRVPVVNLNLVIGLTLKPRT